MTDCELNNDQVMPALAESDFVALKADIAERGVLIPVEYDEDKNIRDGQGFFSCRCAAKDGFVPHLRHWTRAQRTAGLEIGHLALSERPVWGNCAASLCAFYAVRRRSSKYHHSRQHAWRQVHCRHGFHRL